MIYLDNAATTQIAPEVLEAMMPYLTNEFGNAGSLHSLGRHAAKAIEYARKQVADCIGADPKQIIFTSGGTEANNLVFKGMAPYLKANGRTGIVTSEIEHDSILNTVKEMSIKHGFDVTYLKADCSGEVIVETNDPRINNRTGLVSVMCINNEIGTVNRIRKICDQSHCVGALFHTDYVQAFGSMRIDVKRVGCDFLSISSHKIHGPKGIGALYVKNPEILSPLITGGGAQEYGLRGGTENVANIVGFGAACELLSKQFEGHISYAPKKRLFFNTLMKCLENSESLYQVHINAIPYHCSSILNLRFDNIDAQTLVLYLDAQGVCISAGSACRNHESTPSSTLTAIGLSIEEAFSSVRFSFSRYLSEEQIIEAAKITAKAIKALSNNQN